MRIHCVARGCPGAAARASRTLLCPQVAHMTKSEMHLHDTAFIGPALLFLDQYFNSFIDEYIVLWIALVLSFFDLIRYCVSVCNQIASHLHIHVFRIKASAAQSNHH
ncbi:choline/ethanolamine phosphotransferase 1 [Phyllostomus discolor]|uniref:Choline/ethanolamine phosphotransferase 1 n=1 Tax=Phyllostomus discolor TaxID=89673 RepID=A0A833YDI4_9CHIR|nr:choline/ethanolamine phosphotransferase 1 [Phyllostomus discolor]